MNSSFLQFSNIIGYSKTGLRGESSGYLGTRNYGAKIITIDIRGFRVRVATKTDCATLGIVILLRL